jgi:hypothetical protein
MRVIGASSLISYDARPVPCYPTASIALNEGEVL